MQFERNVMRGHHKVSLAVIAALITSVVVSAATSAATLDRIRESGHIKIGYLANARPFTYKTEADSADGYAIALCKHIAAAAKAQLGISELTVDWVAVPFESRFREVQQGKIDLLCTPTVATLSHREDVSFSIPTFPAGVRAVLRADAPPALRDALTQTDASRVVWRGSPAAKTLSRTSVAVVAGTTTEQWLTSRLSSLEIGAKTVLVPDYRAGLQQLLDREVDIFFGERTVVLSAMDGAAAKDLVILDRLFTRDPVAFALARGDENFRLLVDRALNQVYSSAEFRQLYAKWFGEFNEGTQTFFAWNTAKP